MKVIDSHTHLDDISDLEPALKRAKEAGVKAIITVGVNFESDKKILAIQERFKEAPQYPRIYAALGFHPGDIDTFKSDDVFTFIEEEIGKTIAIGEIGLDFWYKEAREEGPARKLQRDIFIRQLGIAKKYDKPVIVHSRGAWKECLEEVTRNNVKRAVFHWYSGPVEILDEIIGKGYFISASPSAEYSPEHKRAIDIAPLESIFLETDSPVTFKPAAGNYRSEPRDVLRALKAVARIKKIEETEVAQKTTENVKAFFGISA